MIEIDQADEFPKFSCGRRTRELLDSINLASKGTNTLGADMVAKELQTVHFKKDLDGFMRTPYSLSR